MSDERGNLLERAAPYAAGLGTRIGTAALERLSEEQRADLLEALVREGIIELRTENDQAGVVVLTLSRQTVERLALHPRATISWAMLVRGLAPP